MTPMTSPQTGPGIAIVPASVYGSVRMVAVDSTRTPLTDARRAEEVTRRNLVSLQRAYYEGTQYDEVNALAAAALNCDPATDTLPEHDRRHPYSTQIQECVDYLADRLGEGWAVEATDSTVAQLLAAVVESSPQLASVDEDGRVSWSTDDSLRDAMIAGDVAAYVGWNPVSGVPFVQLWESEVVQVETSTTDTVERVTREELVWVEESRGNWRQVTQRIVYDMAVNPDLDKLGFPGVLDCRVREFWDTDEAPRQTSWLGMGRLPWQLLRASSRRLRAVRGESLITDAVMTTADRYNAVEQTAYLVARYNSHGNVVITGDAALVEARQDGKIERDVADVLVFPGGTNVHGVLVPYKMDAQEHQREVLVDSLYGLFGLVRLDPGTIATYGNVTGYALEILNQKTESTFRRVRRSWRKDVAELVNLILDVAAWHNVTREQTSAITADGTLSALPPNPGDPFPDGVASPDGTVKLLRRWWEVIPGTVYPNRAVTIKMGVGSITDDVKGRDDFLAGLTDQTYELEQRGLSDPQIREIQERQLQRARDDADAARGSDESGGRQTFGGGGTGSGSSVGSTVADVTRTGE